MHLRADQIDPTSVEEDARAETTIIQTRPLAPTPPRTRKARCRPERRADGPNSGAALAADEATTPRLQGRRPRSCLRRGRPESPLPFGYGGRRHRGQGPAAAAREHPRRLSPTRTGGGMETYLRLVVPNANITNLTL